MAFSVIRERSTMVLYCCRASVQSATEDPHILATYGELVSNVQALAALAQRARLQAEAVFKAEQHLVAAAQIFAAEQAPARALHVALRRLDVVLALLVVRVRKASIDDAIQRDAALRVGGLHAKSGNSDSNG